MVKNVSKRNKKTKRKPLKTKRNQKTKRNKKTKRYKKKQTGGVVAETLVLKATPYLVKSFLPFFKLALDTVKEKAIDQLSYALLDGIDFTASQMEEKKSNIKEIIKLKKFLLYEIFLKNLQKRGYGELFSKDKMEVAVKVKLLSKLFKNDIVPCLKETWNDPRLTGTKSNDFLKSLYAKTKDSKSKIVPNKKKKTFSNHLHKLLPKMFRPSKKRKFKKLAQNYRQNLKESIDKQEREKLSGLVEDATREFENAKGEFENVKREKLSGLVEDATREFESVKSEKLSGLAEGATREFENAKGEFESVKSEKLSGLAEGATREFENAKGEFENVSGSFKNISGELENTSE